MKKQKGKEKPKQSASPTTTTSPCHWPGSPVASINRLACGRAWVDINKANEYRTVPHAFSCTPYLHSAPPCYAIQMKIVFALGVKWHV